MGCSRVTVGLMFAVAGSIAAPGMLLADDYETPGYAAPAANAPGTGIPDLTIPKPQADAPAPGMGILDLAIAKPPAEAAAKPELTFRDRLMQLDNVGPTVQIQPQPGFTTKDSTSSYSTSAGADFTTHNTTASYSTSDGPGMPPRNTTSSFTTVPDPKP